MRVLHHGGDVVQTLPRKLLGQGVVALARLGVRGKHSDVAVGKPELEEGRRRQRQDGQHRHQDEQGPAHDGGGDRVPEPGAGGAPAERDAQKVDPGPEEGEERGQER